MMPILLREGASDQPSEHFVVVQEPKWYSDMRMETRHEQDFATGAPRSLGRVLGLLGEIAKTPGGLSLTELSIALASPKSSLLNLLRPLVGSGHLLRENGRYELGPAVFRLAADILSRRKLPNLIRPYLEELVRRSGETAFLTVIDRDAGLVTYVDCVDSPQMVRYTVSVGTSRPLYGSAAGRVLLAYQPQAWLEDYLGRTALEPMTTRTVTDPRRLRALMAEAGKEGVAVTMGEVVPDAGGIAAPVFNRDGTVDAAVLIGAPIVRFKRELPRLRRIIREIAGRASMAMGYAPSVQK
jgi:IclR family transcriptional regulator, acetate operon repressor